MAKWTMVMNPMGTIFVKKQQSKTWCLDVFLLGNGVTKNHCWILIGGLEPSKEFPPVFSWKHLKLIQPHFFDAYIKKNRFEENGLG